MAISISRRIAFDALLRVDTDAAYAGDLLHAKLSSGPQRKPIKPEDAALATELTLGVLRWQRRLDYFIDAHTKGKKLDAPVRIALRLGAYQLLFLDRIPAHAAVNESVELVKKAGMRSAAGLVNAILRKLASARARKDDLPPMPRRASPAERLAIRASHPTWLVERWLARFGEEETTALLAANNSASPVCLALDHGHQQDFGFSFPFEARLEIGKWLTSAWRLRSGHADLLSQLDSLLSMGVISFQDEASQMVAYLLEVQPGHNVLDVCSAPGGKTLLLARAAGPAGRLLAADVHVHRLNAIRHRFADQQRVVSAAEKALAPLEHKPEPNPFAPSPRAPIQLLALDATQPLPFSVKFDRILVDAPCSGTGTLARHPEIRWRLTPADVPDLQSRQCAILANAIEALAPGGRLVYSTCSLEPEENEQVVEAVLAMHTHCRPVDGRAALRPHLHPGADVNLLFDPRGNAPGYFRTFPPMHRTDGFFAAIIEKL